MTVHPTEMAQRCPLLSIVVSSPTGWLSYCDEYIADDCRWGQNDTRGQISTIDIKLHNMHAKTGQQVIPATFEKGWTEHGMFFARTIGLLNVHVFFFFFFSPKMQHWQGTAMDGGSRMTTDMSGASALPWAAELLKPLSDFTIFCFFLRPPCLTFTEKWY